MTMLNELLKYSSSLKRLMSFCRSALSHLMALLPCQPGEVVPVGFCFANWMKILLIKLQMQQRMQTQLSVPSINTH